MRSRAVLLVVLASACTRLNPAFDVGGDTPHTNTSGAGGTTGHDEVGDGSVSSTKAPGTGEADATSMGSSTMAEVSTGAMVDSTGDCGAVIASLEPVADAFIASGENSCGGFDCESVDSGGSPQGLLENVAGEFQSHLLLSFDLGALVGVHQRLSSVTLTVFVLHRAELDLEVSQVFPIAWTEGDGLGTESAGPGEAAWLWSSNPEPWATPQGSGTFELVLAGAAELGSANVAAIVGSHPVTITLDAEAIDGWIEGPEVVHLLVSKVAGPGEVISFTRESMASPSLTITGC